MFHLYIWAPKIKKKVLVDFWQKFMFGSEILKQDKCLCVLFIYFSRVRWGLDRVFCQKRTWVKPFHFQNRLRFWWTLVSLFFAMKSEKQKFTKCAQKVNAQVCEVQTVKWVVGLGFCFVLLQMVCKYATFKVTRVTRGSMWGCCINCTALDKVSYDIIAAVLPRTWSGLPRKTLQGAIMTAKKFCWPQMDKWKKKLFWFTADVTPKRLFVFTRTCTVTPCPTYEPLGSGVRCNCDVTWPLFNNPQ